MTNKFSQFSVSDSDFEAAVAAAVKTGKTPLTLESQSDEPFRMSVDFDRNATMDSSFASTSADDGTAQKTGKNPLTLALNEQNDEPFQMTVDFERNATMDSSTDVSAEDVWFVFSTKQIDIYYLFPLQTNYISQSSLCAYKN